MLSTDQQLADACRIIIQKYTHLEMLRMIRPPFFQDLICWRDAEAIPAPIEGPRDLEFVQLAVMQQHVPPRIDEDGRTIRRYAGGLAWAAVE